VGLAKHGFEDFVIKRAAMVNNGGDDEMNR
jgi:hypothetical protein